MSAAQTTPSVAVSERIAEVIFVLCQTLTMRLRAATVTQAQLTYIVGRLLGIRKRFRRLVERIRAGHPPRARARKPRPVVLAPEPDFQLGFRPPPPGWRRWAVRPDTPVPLWRSLRQNTFAWLLPLAPNVPGFRESAAWHRAQLLGLLAEPEIQVLLLASRRVGDSLRPLCWMLGIEAAVLYPAPPPASADAAANQVPDENEPPAVATPVPIIAGGPGFPPELARARGRGDFFATG